MSLSLLANVVWHVLAGPQSRHASGTDTARRYARGFSPIMGFADPQRPDFAAFAPHCEPTTIPAAGSKSRKMKPHS